jgi:hypothetical protein
MALDEAIPAYVRPDQRGIDVHDFGPAAYPHTTKATAMTQWRAVCEPSQGAAMSKTPMHGPGQSHALVFWFDCDRSRYTYYANG